MVIPFALSAPVRRFVTPPEVKMFASTGLMVGPKLKLALLVAVGLIAMGSWQGGEMVYSEGTGVRLVKGGWPAQGRA